MNEFKEGDKVTLTTIEDIGEFSPYLKVGDVGTVIHVDWLYRVLFDRIAPQAFQFEAFELQLVS